MISWESRRRSGLTGLAGEFRPSFSEEEGFWTDVNKQGREST